MTQPSPAQAKRGVGAGLAVGLVVALASIAVVFSLLAMPLYMLGRVTAGDRGLDDPFIRNGLFYFALPLGLLLGSAIGGFVGWWYARGGHLPDWRADLHERTAPGSRPDRFGR